MDHLWYRRRSYNEAEGPASTQPKKDQKNSNQPPIKTLIQGQLNKGGGTSKSGWDEKEIIRGFSEIFTFAKECKFNDCNHINNEGCAVTTKLMNGEMNESRYNNFIKFRDGEDDE